jgi:transposase
VKVAHLRLCHSRMMFVRAYPRETQEMVFDAHDRAFAFFKGACHPLPAVPSHPSNANCHKTSIFLSD